MNLAHVISELFQSQLDCGLESYQGSGFVAWIVDGHNRRIEEHFNADDLGSLTEWLHIQLEQRRPTARYSGAPHSLLADLASSARKDPKRVSVDGRVELRARKTLRRGM